MKKLLVLFIAVIFIFVVGCNKTPSSENSYSYYSRPKKTSSQNSSNTQPSFVSSTENSENSTTSSNSIGVSSSSSIIQNSSNSSANSSVDSGVDTPIENTEEKVVSPIGSSSKVRLISTVYKTTDTVICDAIVTDYGADKTGKTDSTNAIQSAINYVANLGGGTVFLPVGNYLVTNKISVPSYVTLRGDWQSPETEKSAYGTVILAKPAVIGSSKPQDKPLISLAGNSGIEGLTFYYPEQDISSLKEYGYTIYADAPVTTTIKNVTMLNSVYGIGLSLNTANNELCNLENIYATFLKIGVAHNYTSDVGFYDNINISTKYWKNASLNFACSNSQALDNYVNSNLIAFKLGDLDDQLISNVTIDKAKIGFYFTTGIRADAGFWGLVNNAQVNAQTGVFADYLNGRSGVVFTNSSLGKVENNSPVGVVKISNTTANLVGSGNFVTESGSVDLTKYNQRLNPTYLKTERLFVAEGLTSGGMVDNSQKLNEILQNVGNAGGVVVVPNGVYRLNSKVTIPKNVELRSSQGVFSRTNQSQNGKNGVVFTSYVSGVTFELSENSGLRGVRIWQPKNDFKSAQTFLSGGGNGQDTAVKAVGSGAYALNNEVVGAYVGFDFTGCDSHIIKSNYGICYSNFIIAGGNNGQIISCLANPNFMTRSNLYDYFDSSNCIKQNWIDIRNSGETNSDFILLRDDIGRAYTVMVKLVNAQNERCLNVFCYGEAGLFDMTGGSAVLVNTSLDYIPNDKAVYTLNSGEMIIVGSLRVYGISLNYKSGTLKAYGRIGFGVTKEKAFDSTISTLDEIEYVSANATRKVLFNCDTKGLNATLNTNSAYVKEGSGSWKINVSSGNGNLSGTFNSIDVSSYKKGYLHFSLYCSDVNNVGIGQIEISSSGTCDKNELNWSFEQNITKSGWNDVYLPISGAGTTGGAIDLTKVNYFRIYALNGNATYYIDNIEFVTD